MLKTDAFVKLARDHNIDPTIIWDIGSFDASQSVELSLAFPSARVLALEADPYNVPKCLSSAQGRASITVLHGALVPSSFWGVLVPFNRAIGQNDQCGSLLMPNNQYPQEMPVEQIMVPAFNSQQLARFFGAPSLLWMDVQGSEWNFFQSSTVRPKLVWLEVAYRPYYEGQPLRDELTARMKGLGYDPIYEDIGIANWFGDVCYLLKA